MKNSIKTEAETFLTQYEKATNMHDFENIRSLIDTNAIYFFSDETLIGLEKIEEAFVRTFNKIQDELYTISDVQWISCDERSATCVYRFDWQGKIEGKLQEGSGRGTNVMIKQNGSWKMVHEHLSKV